MAGSEQTRTDLLEMAASLGDARQMAILGEGNISGRLDDGFFLVKASGTRLASLREEHLVEVDHRPLVAAIQDGSDLRDEEMEQLLLAARRDAKALKPSVESLFHAWLLGLPGVHFVGHTHAVAVNQILCSPRAREFAMKRLIPDQIVYCGAESVLVPYVDPGLTLARTIAYDVESFMKRTGVTPRTILLENHGIIALGKWHTDVMAALSMAEKAARIFVGATALGGPIFMSDDEVRRIEARMDEHYRQRMLQQT